MRIVGWTRFENRKKTSVSKRGKEKKKAWEWAQEEKRARAVRRLREDEILTLQTYADDSGSGPVMWCEADPTKRSALSAGIISSLGVALPHCLYVCVSVCVHVCVKLKNRSSWESDRRKRVCHPSKYIHFSLQHLANEFSLISPHHRQKEALH